MKRWMKEKIEALTSLALHELSVMKTSSLTCKHVTSSNFVAINNATTPSSCNCCLWKVILLSMRSMTFLARKRALEETSYCSATSTSQSIKMVLIFWLTSFWKFGRYPFVTSYEIDYRLVVMIMQKKLVGSSFSVEI